ncbi:polysaccharide deacetylase family protein [Seonamhaeicola aphaedonensis]|uniref:Peptidoglycan/xylan/chitin deacetylase (PgdA/CDA1 family) n=1 Tax=Seonamhaeicola aphaedonensis TaxID=1461338 RepID=A0A3D9HLY5_9FLAO|nr:polysaccharide deacetylase family protein [Seonamhaeicola aphaedonensis]RED50507.1 peptidoglycan/xylan/chitin deacetylase (PgdA/CDA1 family) [Seonamhaeicola aphaedonensis]
MIYKPVKTPLIAKSIFPNYVWDVPSASKSIYLTFDDGPTPEITSWVLNTLKDYNAKATFFCIGKNVEKYPEIFERILVDGHHVGNHTQSHIKGWNSSTEVYLKNVQICDEVIKSQIIHSELSAKNYQNVHLFRPPYGQIKPKQGKKLMEHGYKIIMWDVLSFDWDKKVSEEICLSNVISKAKSGSIVVFHDSLKASKNMMFTLPKVLDYFTKKGYNFDVLD